MGDSLHWNMCLHSTVPRKISKQYQRNSDSKNNVQINICHRFVVLKFDRLWKIEAVNYKLFFKSFKLIHIESTVRFASDAFMETRLQALQGTGTSE